MHGHVIGSIGNRAAYKPVIETDAPMDAKHLNSGHCSDKVVMLLFYIATNLKNWEIRNKYLMDVRFLQRLSRN